jgi:hypothetical protein
MNNNIEIATLRNNGLSFRSVSYPLRKHYILQVGRTEARIIIAPNSSRATRSLITLALAIAMFKAS